jgi:two-component system chemotaxis sensor kinase CheA
MAVPLSMVDRLEEFATSAIERSGPRSVVQYRQEILPLFEVESLLEERRQKRRAAKQVETARDVVPVIVHSGDHGRLGLVVDEIVDIVEQRMDLQGATRAGVLGTMVIHDRVTEVLDLAGLLRPLEIVRERELAAVGG